MLHQQRERGRSNKTQPRYTQQNLIGSKHSGSIPGLQSRSCIMRITMSLEENLEKISTGYKVYCD